MSKSWVIRPSNQVHGCPSLRTTMKGRAAANWRPLPKTIPSNVDELIRIATDLVGNKEGRLDKDKLDNIVDYLRSISLILLYQIKEQELALTSKELVNRLSRMISDTRKILEDFRSISPFMRLLLNQAFLCLSENIVTKSSDSLDLGNAAAEQALAALQASFQRILVGWEKGLIGVSTPSQPGPSRSQQRLLGDARTMLAHLVAQLVYQELGLEGLSAEDHRPVYTIVSTIWTYATGRPEENANLRKYVRQGVKVVLIEAEARDLSRDFENRLKSLRRRLYRNLDNMEVLRQLQTQLTALNDRGRADINRLESAKRNALAGVTSRRFPNPSSM